MEVSPSLQIQARKYLEYVNKEGNIYSNQHQSLNQLSKYLREGIFREVYVKTLLCIPYLKQNFTMPFISKLALSMKEMSFGPDELIMKRGLLEEHFLFVVASGEVEVFMDVSQDINKLTHNCIKPFKKLKKGDHFGTLEFFTNNKSVSYNVRSLGVSRIQCLSLNDFQQTIEEFPQDREVYCYLRDNFIFNSNHYMLNQSCISCGSSTHLIQNCQLLFYTPHQIRVIRIYNKNNEIIRAQFKRSLDRHRHKTLQDRDIVEKDIEKFVVENTGYLDASTYYDESEGSNFDEDDDEDFDANDTLQGYQLDKQDEILKFNTEGQEYKQNSPPSSFQNKSLSVKSSPQQRQSQFSVRVQEKQLQFVSEDINEDELNEDQHIDHITSGGGGDLKSDQMQYRLNIQNPGQTNEQSRNEQESSNEDLKVKPRTVSFAKEKSLHLINGKNSTVFKTETDMDLSKENMEDKKTLNSLKVLSINSIPYNKHQWHFCDEDVLSSSAPSHHQLNPNTLILNEFNQIKQDQSTFNDLDYTKKNTENTSNQIKTINSNSRNITLSTLPLSQKQTGGLQSVSNNTITSPSKQMSTPSQIAFKWSAEQISGQQIIQEKSGQNVKTELDLNQITKLQKKLLLRKNKTDQQKSKEERQKKQNRNPDQTRGDGVGNSIQAFVQTLMQQKQLQKDLISSPDQKPVDHMKNNKLQQEQKKTNNSIQMLNQFIRRASQVVPQIQGNNINISNSLMNFDMPPSSSNLKIASQVNLKNIEDQDLTKMKKLLELLGVNDFTQDQQGLNDNFLDATRFFDKYPFDVMKAFKTYFPNYNFKHVVLQANRIIKNSGDYYKFKKKRTMADRKKTVMEHKKTIIGDRVNQFFKNQ